MSSAPASVGGGRRRVGVVMSIVDVSASMRPASAVGRTRLTLPAADAVAGESAEAASASTTATASSSVNMSGGNLNPGASR